MDPGATFEDDAVEGGIVGGEVADIPGREDVGDFFIRLMDRRDSTESDDVSGAASMVGHNINFLHFIKIYAAL